jgi:[FeFe] hydrogenase (group B1/B3)
MLYDNEASHIRRELLLRVAKLFYEGALAEKAGRIPLEMRPKGYPPSRCCIYKDRSILRYRVLATLGFRVEDETDEPIPLSVYASQALKRDRITGPVLTVIEEACSACVQINYFVTNACRGCLARPCLTNCAKEAMHFAEGHAHIDHAKCINCGKCQQVCPYHAIVYVPIPCKEACPVDAIFEAEGHENINYDKCIFCGKCMRACPFGAVMERSAIVDVLRALAGPKPVVAIAAPAVVGQFNAKIEQIAAGARALGFADLIEVALGADETGRREAAEFSERMKAGQRLMTTSCCPAYFHAVNKHLPELKPFVSETRSPMHYTAELVKAASPDARVVFIGPCVAKRNEALHDPIVDYVLTFEEFDALLAAKNIELKGLAPAALSQPASPAGRGFPLTGGVAAAVKSMLAPDRGVELKLECIESLNRDSIKLLKKYAKEGPANFLEVMGCEGGCVGGPATVAPVKSAAARVQAFVKKS